MTKRQEIIDAMYHLIATEGYDKASISKVCRVVGITKPSLYYYFDSKEDLLIAVVDSMNPFFSRPDDRFLSIEHADDYRDELVQFGNKVIDKFRSDVERQVVIANLRLLTSQIPSLKDHELWRDQQWTSTLSNILRRGVELGALPQDFDVDRMAQLLHVVINGISESMLSNEHIDLRIVWQEVIDLLLERAARQSEATPAAVAR